MTFLSCPFAQQQQKEMLFLVPEGLLDSASWDVVELPHGTNLSLALPEPSSCHTQPLPGQHN